MERNEVIGPAAGRMSRIIRPLLHYAVRRWRGLGAVLATLLLGTVLNVLRPWPMKVVVDHVLQGGPVSPEMSRGLAWLPGATAGEGLLAWCVAATVLLFLLGWVASVASAYASIGFGQRMIYDLAGDLFQRLQRLSFQFHDRQSVGDTIRRVTVDCGAVSVVIKDALLPAAAALFSLAVMFGVMWRLNHHLTIVALAVVPLMALVFRRYAEPMADLNYAQEQADGRLYHLVEQTLFAIPVVQAFAREEDADRRFRAATDEVLHATLATTRVEAGFNMLIGLATAAGTACILYIGASQVLRGQLTVGAILVFLAYLGSLYGPLNSLMYTSAIIQSASGGVRRVLEILESQQEVRERPGAPPLPPVRGHLRFEGVTFGYLPGRPVLQDIWLDVAAGDTVAIIGPTGAGKSTLASLVPRFADPWRGRVTLDGHDIAGVQLGSLRRQVALVLQETFLFPLTIAENVAYGRPEASREEIEAAARAANAHAFIERLPDGYDTVVGERGATLSGGERQRLAIARALLKDAPILILDEPTSALDVETEELVLDALERLIAGRTTLIIAHRASTIRSAARIVTVEEGRVRECAASSVSAATAAQDRVTP